MGVEVVQNLTQIVFDAYASSQTPIRMIVRIQPADGSAAVVVPIDLTPAAADRTLTRVKILAPLTGKIVGASVGFSTAAVIVGPGQIYVVGWVRQGFQSDTILLSGYLYSGHNPSYPVGPLEGPLEGPGWIHSLVGANPAAGAEVAEVVPANTVWKLNAISVVFVASAQAANRLPYLVVDDGSTVYLVRAKEDLPITAGLTRTIAWIQGNELTATVSEALADGAATVIWLLKLPAGERSLYLWPGYRIRTLTTALDAADDYAAPKYNVEEWILPAT